MKTQTIGDIRIDRVVDMEGSFSSIDFLLPEANPDEIIDQAGDWLCPRFVDPADNNVIMSFHSLLIRTGKYTILVDSCIGDDKERPNRPPWHHKKGPFLDNLRAQGVQPEEVDFVMCTHMHGDHVGWNTKLENGQWVPTFPNAKYLFAQKEFDFWEKENYQAQQEGREAELNHGCWFDSVLPVIEAGQHVVVGSDHALDDTMWLEPAEGHTPGAIIMHAKHGGDHAIMVGDMLHTAAQLAKPELSSRFCWDPVMSANTRKRVIDQYCETNTTILTAHFPTPTAGRIIRNGDAFKMDMGE
jgi:glyoxylase-like metal-dependent hydrolase (beta-lactamase superfamily II)